MLILMSVVHPEAIADGVAKDRGHLRPATEALLGGFADYLRGERALAERTIDGYVRRVRAFFGWHLSHHGSGSDVAAVTVGVVNDYLTDRLGVWAVHSVYSARIALRAWLQDS